jgi:hypothetical protein
VGAAVGDAVGSNVGTAVGPCHTRWSVTVMAQEHHPARVSSVPP